MKLNRIVGNVNQKNVLLLQGPMGSYFNTLDRRFTTNGAKVFRIGFNAGDEFFSSSNHYKGYKDIPKNWHKFIKNYLIEYSIDKLFVFGDCRFYQKIAIKIAKKLDIEIYVFEEGYIRPNFITLEQYGVNGYSLVPRDRKFYDNLLINVSLTNEIENLINFKPTFPKLAREAILYYWIVNLFYFKYPHYIHHRDISLWTEFKAGCTNVFRKYLCKITEKGLNKKFQTILSKQYYLVPLQTHGDYQIKTHSSYKSIEVFIKEVMESFSLHASKDKYLVFKHHPVDRGRKNYKNYILELATSLNIENRIIVTWDVHLPTLLKNALGTVQINSTVGISSLYHNTPTICLGDAIYDIEGLTCKDMDLNKFWNNLLEVDSELFYKFRAYLINTTQINGSFYL